MQFGGGPKRCIKRWTKKSFRFGRLSLGYVDCFVSVYTISCCLQCRVLVILCLCTYYHHHHQSADELPPATTVLCQFRQLARANHVVCVCQKVLNVSEKRTILYFFFYLYLPLKAIRFFCCRIIQKLRGSRKLTFQTTAFR